MVRPSGGSRNGVVSYGGTGVNRRSDLVDDLVLGTVAGRLTDPDVVAVVAERTAPHVSTARVELDALRARVRTLIEMYTAGDLELEDLNAGADRHEPGSPNSKQR